VEGRVIAVVHGPARSVDHGKTPGNAHGAGEIATLMDPADNQTLLNAMPKAP